MDKENYEKSKIKHFTDLIVYKKAHEMVLFTYKLTKAFPQEERYALVDQMRRSAVSVTSNIAEGFGRSTGKDKKQFYAISQGSVYELESQFLISKDLGYISPSELINFQAMSSEVIRILSGIMKSAFSR